MPGVAVPTVGRLGLTSPPSRPDHSEHRYNAPLRLPLPVSGRFACRSLPDTHTAPLSLCPVCGSPGLGGFPRRQGLVYRAPYPVLFSQETGGSLKFPSCPFERMPPSQTPAVSFGLALSPSGLLPSDASTPSAFPILRRVILLSATIQISGLNHAACALAPSSFVHLISEIARGVRY